VDQYHGDKYPTHLHHHSGLWDWSFDSLVPSYSTSEVAPCHELVCLFTFPKMSRFPSPNQYSLRQKNRVHRIKEGSGLSSFMKSFSPKGLLLGPIHCRIRSSFWDRFQTPSTIRVFTSSPDNLTGALNPPPTGEVLIGGLYIRKLAVITHSTQANHWKVPYLGLAVRTRGARVAVSGCSKRISERRNRRHKDKMWQLSTFRV